MKYLLPIFVCSLLISLPAPSDAAERGRRGGKARAEERSAPRERRAERTSSDDSSSGIPAPQVLTEGSSLLGARIGLGTVTYFGLNYEHMFGRNFGAVADLRYGSYSSGSVAVAGASIGEWKYSAWALAAQATFHADFLKVTDLDLFVSAGLVRTFVSATWTSTALAAATTADSGSFDFVGYINGRYFFDSNWGATASLGTGLGTFNIGVDYLF